MIALREKQSLKQLMKFIGLKKCIGNIFVFFILLLVGACASQPQIRVEVLHAYDAAFMQKAGWTGADGAYSIALSDDKMLWLFGDTWVGEVQDGRHVHADLIHNSIGIQSGRSPADADIRFFFNQAGSGKVSAFIKPDDERGWFWPYHGILDRKGLFLFLVQIDRMQGKSDAFFTVAGNWLARVDNPDDSPRLWHVEQMKIPWSQFADSGDTIFGSTVLAAGKYYYIYGTTEDIKDGFHTKYMIVARVPPAHFTEFSRWRFFSNGHWVPNASKATRLCQNMANEYSVSFLKSIGKYIVVYSENSASDTIRARLAAEPFGPWSEPINLYSCPEGEWDDEIFCYAAKGHPALATSPDELIITYVTNSNDFDQIANDTRLYRPRFIRVRLNY